MEKANDTKPEKEKETKSNQQSPVKEQKQQLQIDNMAQDLVGTIWLQIQGDKQPDDEYLQLFKIIVERLHTKGFEIQKLILSMKCQGSLPLTKTVKIQIQTFLQKNKEQIYNILKQEPEIFNKEKQQKDYDTSEEIQKQLVSWLESNFENAVKKVDDMGSLATVVNDKGSKQTDELQNKEIYKFFFFLKLVDMLLNRQSFTINSQFVKHLLENQISNEYMAGLLKCHKKKKGCGCIIF